LKSVFVGVRVEANSKWLDQHFQVLKKLDYPPEDLRIVYSVRKGVDTTIVERIRNFKESTKLNIEAFSDPYSRNLVAYGAEGSSAIMTGRK